jgi:excisionase family DNA binding protein
VTQVAIEMLPPEAKLVQKILYTRKEAAEMLSLSVSTVDMLISRGVLGSRKIGHKRLIPHAALVSFSQKNHAQLWVPKSETHGQTWSKKFDENQVPNEFEKTLVNIEN